MRKKTGEIEVIRKLKSFRIDTKPKKIKFSAYYNNNSSQSFKKQLHRKPKPSGDSPNPSAINRISLPSQSTAPEESLALIFVASEQRLDASAFTRTFNLQRLKSQICFIYQKRASPLPAANSYLKLMKYRLHLLKCTKLCIPQFAKFLLRPINIRPKMLLLMTVTSDCNNCTAKFFIKL